MNNKIFFVSQNEENDSTEEADNEIQNYSDEVENEIQEIEEMEELEEEFSSSKENKKRTRQKNQPQSNNNAIMPQNSAPKRGRPRKKMNPNIYQDSSNQHPSNKSNYNQQNKLDSRLIHNREQYAPQQYAQQQPLNHPHHKYPTQNHPSNAQYSNSSYNYPNQYASKSSTNPNHQQIYSSPSYPYQMPTKYSRSTVPQQYHQSNPQNTGYPVSHNYSSNPLPYSSPYNPNNYRKENYMQSSQQEYSKDNTSIKFSHYKQIYPQNEKANYGGKDQFEVDSPPTQYVAPIKTTVHQINSAPSSSIQNTVEVMELSSGIDRFNHNKKDFERASRIEIDRYNDPFSRKHKKQTLPTYSPLNDSPLSNEQNSPPESYITQPKQSAPFFDSRFNQPKAPSFSTANYLPKISDKINSSNNPNSFHKNSLFPPNSIQQSPSQNNQIILPPIFLDSSHYQSTQLPPIQNNLDQSLPSIKSTPSFPLSNKNTFVKTLFFIKFYLIFNIK